MIEKNNAEGMLNNIIDRYGADSKYTKRFTAAYENYLKFGDYNSLVNEFFDIRLDEAMTKLTK